MPATLTSFQAFAFETDLGWFALAFASPPRPVLSCLVFGYGAENSALRRLKNECPADRIPAGQLPTEVAQWVDWLQRYAAGEPVSLKPIPLDEDHLTPFGKQVARACRAIPYGATRSYGQLALAAGSPRAARAVGSVMSGNRTPLVVPCHRVLGAGGKLGGFSAPQGVAMKRRLLELESGRLFRFQFP